MKSYRSLAALLLITTIALMGCQFRSDRRSSHSQTGVLQVVSVHDGDTMRVQLNGKSTSIRLCGIDAPELKQQLGQASRDNLRSLVQRSNNQVRLTIVDVDRYGREVAEVTSLAGAVLNVEQIRSGNAYLYRQYANHCPHEPQMEQAEAAAQQAKQGVWKYQNALKPWEYRKKQRQAS